MTVKSIEDVQFVNLEPTLRGRRAPASDAIVAAACRRFPGQYAVLPLAGRQAKGLQIQINSKGSRAFPKDEFRVRLNNGTAYVAYVGGDA